MRPSPSLRNRLEKERIAPSPLHRSTRHRWCMCRSSRPSMDDSPENCTCRVPLPRLFRSSYIRAWMRASPSPPFPPPPTVGSSAAPVPSSGALFRIHVGPSRSFSSTGLIGDLPPKKGDLSPQESEPNRRWKERPCARAARARDRSKAQNGTPRRG